MKRCLNHGLNGLKDDTDYSPSGKSGAIKSVQSKKGLNHGLNGLKDDTDYPPSGKSEAIKSVQSKKGLNHGLNGLKDDTDYPPSGKSEMIKSVQSINPCKSVIQTGFKQTEVGVIPEEWEVISFQEEFNISAGGDVNLKLLSSAQDEIHCFPIYSNAINEQGLYGYCSYADHPAHSITITARGTLGVATYRDHKYTAIGRVLVLEPKREAAGKFFAEYINSRVNFAIESTGVPQLTAPQISGYRLAVPPLPEQRAIAAVLSDVDALLAKLDQLIAKKRDLKQATMQQLLTGQTRLPGFSGEWEVKRLGEFTAIRNLKVLPSNVDPDTLCVELEHVGQGDGRLVETSAARYSTSSKYRFLKGDVLFGRLRSYLRKFWLADQDGICTTEIWPLMVDPSQACNSFLHTIVQTDHFIEVASISYGTHMPRADWEVIRNFEIRLPGLEEQTAIAAILSDMDATIAALGSRRDKTRALKQGMMQELLTGRIRLV